MAGGLANPLKVSTPTPVVPPISIDQQPVSALLDTASHRLQIAGQTLTLNDPAAPSITVNPFGTPHVLVAGTLLSSGGVDVKIDGNPTQLISPALASSSTSTKTSEAVPSSTSDTSSATISNAGSTEKDSSTRSSDTGSAASRTSATMSDSSSATAGNQSSSSTASPSTQRSSSSNGLSKGAAAGIGVGCAIAGALIAALIVFALMRGRRKRPSRSYSMQEKAAVLSKQANGSASTGGAASGAFVMAENSLPLPLEDAAIGGEMSRLQTLIKNYAQSFYHTSPVTGKTPDLSALGPNLSIPPATLAAMLANPKTRIVAIRYCLAWIIFSRLGLHSDASTSLLPPEVASCARPISADTASRSSNLSLAPWRALTHWLLSPSYPASSAAPLNGAALQSAVSALDTILQPYADTTRDSYERMTKLEEIIKRGSKFGWTLFGQVSCFDYDWQRRTPGEVGIFPALLQTVDEKGEKLGGRGRILWEGEGTRVEGV